MPGARKRQVDQHRRHLGEYESNLILQVTASSVPPAGFLDAMRPDTLVRTHRLSFLRSLPAMMRALAALSLLFALADTRIRPEGWAAATGRGLQGTQGRRRLPGRAVRRPSRCSSTRRSIDVDHKGRVWVCEAVNYRRKDIRPADHPQGGRPHRRPRGHQRRRQGGRGDHASTRRRRSSPRSASPSRPYPDGKGRRSSSASRPTSSCSRTRTATCKADGPPKKFLTGFGGFDHDHGVHGIIIGPDGKLYFTVGDAGVEGPAVERRQGQASGRPTTPTAGPGPSGAATWTARTSN